MEVVVIIMRYVFIIFCLKLCNFATSAATITVCVFILFFFQKKREGQKNDGTVFVKKKEEERGEQQ